MSAVLQVVEPFADVVVDHDWPLVPEGQYKAMFIGHDVVEMLQFKVKGKPTPKLFLRFKLFDAGEHSEKVLFMACRVRERITQKRFRVGRRSKLIKMLCRVLNPRTRVDRITLTDLKGRLLKVKVRTVVKDAEGQDVHAALAYSVVDDIIRTDCL